MKLHLHEERFTIILPCITRILLSPKNSNGLKLKHFFKQVDITLKNDHSKFSIVITIKLTLSL